MAKQTINTGTAPNDGTGDTLKSSFTKCNDNFTELYAAVAVPPQGRLTLVTATPVMTSNASAITTIRYTPYVGNKIPIYDGTSMVMTTFTELSNVTTASSVGSAGPAAVTTNSNYDLFVWSNGGTVTLTRGPVWTNATTRSAGTALTMVNGIYLNNASITNGPAASRGTYVGAVRSNGSSQIDWIHGAIATGGTAGVFGVWNCYNRVEVATFVGDSTDSWTYGTAAWRAPNGSATMRVSYVVGLAEDPVDAIYAAVITAGASSTAAVGVGVDSTTAFSGATGLCNLTISNSNPAFYRGIPGLGYHFVSAIEFASDPTSTFSGDFGVPTWLQTGLLVKLRM